MNKMEDLREYGIITDEQYRIYERALENYTMYKCVETAKKDHYQKMFYEDCEVLELLNPFIAWAKAVLEMYYKEKGENEND